MSMIVGVCTIELALPMAYSLKDKRQVLRSLIQRLRNEFNVAVAEVDALDTWNRAVLGVACVSNDEAYAHGLLEKVVRRIEGMRLDATLVDYEIEMW